MDKTYGVAYIYAFERYILSYDKQLNLPGSDISSAITNEFDRQPDLHAKEQYLLFTLSNLNNNNAVSLSTFMFQEIIQSKNKHQMSLKNTFMYLINTLSDHSDIIKSIKKGNYVMNVVETEIRQSVQI